MTFRSGGCILTGVNPGRDRRRASVAAGVLGFVVPAIGVYVVLRHAWPQQHDLSDIGTGLLRLMLSLVAGLIGAVVAVVLTRLIRRG